jgi:hypothetical protein
VQLEPLYRATFTTPERGPSRLRELMAQKSRTFLSPKVAQRDASRRVCSHLTGNERYTWLNNTVCAVAGEVRPRTGGDGFAVVFDVAELIWQPLD